MARVLIHSLVFPPDGVSTAQLMAELAMELRGCGHDVLVLTSTPHYNVDALAVARQPIRPAWFGWLGRSDFRGIPVFHVQVPRKGSKVWRRVLDYFQFHVLSLLAILFAVPSVDIILAASPPLSIGVISWLYARIRGVPSIYNVQEIYPDYLINQGIVQARFLVQALRCLESFVYAHNTFLVAISEEFTATLRARGVPAERTAVIPNFVDTRAFRPLARDESLAAQLGLASRFVVLYAGNVGLSQDWETFLAAAERLRGEPIVFLVVGDGARRQWLAQQVERRSLESVRVLGYQPREAMSPLYALSDLHLIPLRPATALDTFPSKVYTVMACGKPVLASVEPQSGVARLLRETGAGEFVPPANAEALATAIRRATTEPERLAGLGQRGRDFVVRHHTPAAAGKAYSRLIHALLAAHSESPSPTARGQS